MPDGRWWPGLLMTLLLLTGGREGIGRRSTAARGEGPTGVATGPRRGRARGARAGPAREPARGGRGWAQLTTPRPEGRGFQPSRAGVPVSRPTAPEGSP